LPSGHRIHISVPDPRVVNLRFERVR